MSTFGVTLSRHLLEMELRGRDDDAEISVLISQLAFAAKILSREMGRAALVGRLGLVGNANATGDAQKKLDVYSNAVVLDAISLGGFVAGVVSEEMEDVRVVACGEDARYILCVDPLDGSANTDIDGAVATIFAIYRKARPGCEDILAELVGGAVELVSAGYVLYGPSTIFVCTFRDGVHGFTLDTSLGEFLLSHENVRCPTRGRYYSTNVGSVNGWYPNVKKYLAYLNAGDEVTGRPYSLRYSGALVADVHRSLVEGGIYFYPAKGESTEGKLCLLYECAPLAKVVEQAGGRASTGLERVLDIQPTSIHQRVPFAIGSVEDVRLYEKFLREGGP